MKIEIGDCVTFYTPGNILKERYIKGSLVGLVLEIKDLKQTGHLIDDDLRCLVLWNDAESPVWVKMNKLDVVWKKSQK